MQLVNIAKNLRILGVIGLLSIIASEPDWVGMPIALSASFVSMVATYIALYLLDKRYPEVKLFKSSVYQLLIFLPLGIFSLYVETNLDLQSVTSAYIILAVMFVLLSFLAYINYKMARKLGQIAKLSNNMLFRYGAIVLLVSAYTMPIIIGLIFFVLAIVLFLLGCITYKDVANNPESQV